MTAADVIDLYARLADLGIQTWIGGGWGVDALLGEQTRPHGDLDIVMQERDLPKLRELLELRGYLDVERDDTSPWNFVLADDDGREVDVHAIVFDTEGNGLYGPAEKGVMFPAASLSGSGAIDGHAVRCISAEYQVKFHTGYELHDSDLGDVAALCERFGIDYPDEYVRQEARQE